VHWYDQPVDYTVHHKVHLLFTRLRVHHDFLINPCVACHLGLNLSCMDEMISTYMSLFRLQKLADTPSFSCRIRSSEWVFLFANVVKALFVFCRSFLNFRGPSMEDESIMFLGSGIYEWMVFYVFKSVKRPSQFSVSQPQCFVLYSWRTNIVNAMVPLLGLIFCCMKEKRLRNEFERTSQKLEIYE